MKCMTWECLSYTKVAMDECIMFVFTKEPEIDACPIELRGGTIMPGDKIKGMFGPNTSAQYMDFHPIAPGHLIYEGVFRDLEGDIVLCRRPDIKDVGHYWGWLLPHCEGHLFTLLRSGATIRTINTDYIYLNENMPPLECLEDTHYWKKKAKKEVTH